MIVDFHTHLFPPEIAARRDLYLESDDTFRELYDHPKATLATAPDLLASMEAGGIDRSVALGFAWRDAGLCREHNDYLIESARLSPRIIPFCTLPLGAGIAATEQELRRCAELGAPGFGELRPDNHGFDLAGDDGKRLGKLAAEAGAILLFHASEPVGHSYAGKRGMDIAVLYQFIVEHPEVRVVAAHWGGGLPFYALMPEVKLALAGAFVDTAATSLLYNPSIYQDAARLIGAEHILFGSDFPLLGQKRSRERIEQSGLADDDVAAVLGDNAASLLGLSSAATAS